MNVSAVSIKHSFKIGEKIKINMVLYGIFCIGLSNGSDRRVFICTYHPKLVIV